MSQEESIELEKALSPLVAKYGEKEVLREIKYLLNFIIREREILDK